MKTIEIIAGEQKAQFTTKSVTFDGKEFFYSNMSDVTNNAEGCFYTFTYDNETKTLPYEAKDAKILNAIFSQVQNLHAAKKQTPVQTGTVASTEPLTEANEPTAALTEHTASDDTITSANTAADDAETTNTSEAATEPIAWAPGNTESALDEKAAKKAEREKRKAEKREAKERKKAEKAAKKESAEKSGAEISQQNDSEGETASQDTESQLPDGEKKNKIKKSVIVFAIVIAIMAVLALVYFLAFGTSSEPSPMNPSSMESQQSNDIDQMIDELTNEE